MFNKYPTNKKDYVGKKKLIIIMKTASKTFYKILHKM